MPRAPLALLLLAACGGVAPLPDQRAAEEPPAASLDDAGRAAVAAAGEEALARLAAGDFDAAEAAAARALALDPRAARALAVRARCTMQAARAEAPPVLRLWREAEGDLRLASRLAPHDPEVALLHAELLAADGHLSAAAAALAPSLEQNPRHARCVREAARLRYELGEERAALPLLLRLRELEPGDPVVLYRIGQCQLRRAATAQRENEEKRAVAERFARAAATFAEYRHAVPDDGEGCAAQAFALLHALRAESERPSPEALEPVLQLYERAGVLLPGSPEPEFHAGVVHELRGDDAAARAAYRRALERDPEHLPALLNLAASLAKAGEVEAARSHARRALALQPSASERRALERFVKG